MVLLFFHNFFFKMLNKSIVSVSAFFVFFLFWYHKGLINYTDFYFFTLITVHLLVITRIAHRKKNDVYIFLRCFSLLCLLLSFIWLRFFYFIFFLKIIRKYFKTYFFLEKRRRKNHLK
jgi:hypothetical protein